MGKAILYRLAVLTAMAWMLFPAIVFLSFWQSKYQAKAAVVTTTPPKKTSVLAQVATTKPVEVKPQQKTPERKEKSETKKVEETPRRQTIAYRPPVCTTRYG
jgi:hypothetical protein